MAATLEEGSWKLDKYARYLLPDKSKTYDSQQDTDLAGEWKMYDNRQERLHASLLTTSHLLVSQGSKIMENYALIAARSWMRVVSKGDSVLFLCKIKDENRKFRIKFSTDDKGSGLDHCKEFTKRVSYFLTVKTSAEVEVEKHTDTQSESQPTKLSGTVDLDKMADFGKVSLPLAYAQTNLPMEHLAPLLRLCLADPNFPKFVAQVESELKTIQHLET